MRTISVGHSPDADDIFMYYAIKFGWVSLPKVKFENIALDIETLNQATLKGTYDICAISFALYPFVKDDFALLKTAVLNQFLFVAFFNATMVKYFNDLYKIASSEEEIDV